MKILFIHQNYPGQYREILPRLCAQEGHDVRFLTQRKSTPTPVGHTIVRYSLDPLPEKLHPYTAWYQRCIANAIGAAQACARLKSDGFTPDVIVGHAGWGELIFVKEVYPDTPLLGYFEYYFIPKGGLVGFDPEFPPAKDISARLHARNAPNFLTVEKCDDGYTASTWQKQTYPALFHDKIKVFHEGIRTDTLEPQPDFDDRIEVGGHVFSPQDECVTFIARNLEPARGIHTLMRSLPDLQKRRHRARVIIIGGDDVSYGARLKDGTFREQLTQELGDRIDLSRVHFVGRVPYPTLIKLLHLSRCHVYLTAPFVISWSMLEAMALGKIIVASDVAPVRTHIKDGETGYLVDFFSPTALAEKIAFVLENERNLNHIKSGARKHVVDNYDFNTVCYPAFRRFIER